MAPGKQSPSMHSADWIVLSLYLAATVGIGVLLGKLVKTPSQRYLQPPVSSFLPHK